MLALTDAEQLLLRPLFAAWGPLVTVGGLREWARITGRDVLRVVTVVETPGGQGLGLRRVRAPFRVRSQRAVAAAGYAVLLVATLGLPPGLWVTEAPWLPAWLWLLGSLLLSVMGVRLLQRLGQAFSRSRLAPLAG